MMHSTASTISAHPTISIAHHRHHKSMLLLVRYLFLIYVPVNDLKSSILCLFRISDNNDDLIRPDQQQCSVVDYSPINGLLATTLPLDAFPATHHTPRVILPGLNKYKSVHHRQKFVCQISGCSKVFLNGGSLRRHISVQHTKTARMLVAYLTENISNLSRKLDTLFAG